MHSKEFKFNKRIVLIANRNPYILQRKGNKITCEKTAGGLVTALDPLMQKVKGTWVCWRTTDSEIWSKEKQTSKSLKELNEVQVPAENPKYLMKRVLLSEREVGNYYNGYSNRVLWPLFHNFLDKCRFHHPSYWTTYLSVNKKFAEAAREVIKPKDVIWIQDYHLMAVPKLLRPSFPKNKIGFFLHIPFPPYEIFRVLPNSRDILLSLLECNLIGVHIKPYVFNFLNAVKNILKLKVDFDHGIIYYKKRKVLVKEFPISIDTDMFLNLVKDPAVEKTADKIRKSLHVPTIGIGVDRLDFTKGILQRLYALEKFFKQYKEYRGKISFIQIVVPSRTDVKEYKEMRHLIETEIARINGMYSTIQWRPVYYFYRSFNQKQLVGYYRAADFALITPLIDGLNLVAEEYALCSKPDSLLILSLFTGAAKVLKKSFGVNPYSEHHTAEVLYNALNSSKKTRRKINKDHKDYIINHNIYWWVKRFLTTLSTGNY